MWHGLLPEPVLYDKPRYTRKFTLIGGDYNQIESQCMSRNQHVVPANGRTGTFKGYTQLGIALIDRFFE